MGKRKRMNSRTEEDYDFNPYLTKLSFTPDEYQTAYQKAIAKYPVTWVDAASGTGKTTLAVQQGFEFLRKGICQQLIYIRFPDDRYMKQGFLPGTLEEKESKLFFPFFDAIEELSVSERSMEHMRENEQLVLTTDSTMRGRNLKHSFVIIDEAQNARKISDLQLLLTRIHDKGGKAVVIGHSGQQDNRGVELTKKYGYTPFQAYKIHMLKKSFTKECVLLNNYRGEISQWADKIQETLDEL
ncbi:PIN domain protein [Lysinibacillus phage vB_LfM_LysYB1]|nr:PIN domain protein [Lysinibacillus phage vB_LfM_LysYB1]WAB25269.1 PIN domain protein [Lysinibacillus phage vB_LfM_LysYB2]